MCSVHTVSSNYMKDFFIYVYYLDVEVFKNYYF